MSNEPKVVAGEDELVFSIGKDTQEVKEVKNIPLLPLVPEFHPILKEKMADYDFASESTVDRQALAEAMIYTMRMTGAIGLAAPQVGAKLRMFVMDRINMEKGERIEALVCYNPVILRELEPPVPSREGCLSFPGLSLQVKRPNAVEVRYEDASGQMFEVELVGLDAKVFQHETDHVNGILFTSKVSRELIDWEREKQRKRVKAATKATKKRAKMGIF